MTATRVYTLAKELGVKSSAIVDKCQSEGLDVKNHMASISAGLAATIREWFSEGENVTTIETTLKVDLAKVRVKKKAKRKSVSKKPKAEKAESVAVAEPQEEESADEPVTAVAQQPDVVEEPPAERPVYKAEPQAKPESVAPAGPMLEKPFVVNNNLSFCTIISRISIDEPSNPPGLFLKSKIKAEASFSTNLFNAVRISGTEFFENRVKRI